MAKYLQKTDAGGGLCLICRNSYVRFTHSKRHFIRTHVEPYCGICQMEFPSAKSYVDHRILFHSATNSAAQAFIHKPQFQNPDEFVDDPISMEEPMVQMWN